MLESLPKVFFLGAGQFAVPVLERIAASRKLCLVGAGTQPDKAAGRKRILTPSPLGIWADSHSVLCERIDSVNTPEFLLHIQALKPDLIVVVAFGQILKEPMLNVAPLGCLNVHASLLPKYRGASPIKSAILAGEKFSGVSFMRMEKGLDTGPVFQVFPMEIPFNINAEDLELNLSMLAADRIENCILKIAAHKLEPEPQDHNSATISRKIHKQDGSVDWNEDAAVLVRKVRAYHKWPNMSFTIPLKNRTILAKITSASFTSWEAQSGAVPGKFMAYSNNKMMIACGHGALLIERILPEGKKEMSVADFLNGSRIQVGDIMLNGPVPDQKPVTQKK